MSSARVFRSIALMAGGTAVAWAAILSGAHASQAEMSVPSAPADPVTASFPSDAPANPGGPVVNDLARAVSVQAR